MSSGEATLRGFVDRLLLGPRRRRRWMQRRLADLDRLDQGLPPRRHRRGARGRLVTLGAFVIFVVGTAFMLWSEYGVRVSAEGVAGADRLLPAVPVIDRGGAFEYLSTTRGEPLRYSPCRRLSILVNDRLQPPGAKGILEEAAASVSTATGLLLTVDGSTDELPDWDSRGPGAPRSSEPGAAPVLVAWTTPARDPELRGPAAGVGGSTPGRFGPTGELRYVEGAVSLDTPALAHMLAQPGGRASVRAVVMHELAHVVGLGHVDDPRELMHEENLGQTSFGPGDLEGLAVLGRGSCL